MKITFQYALECGLDSLHDLQLQLVSLFGQAIFDIFPTVSLHHDTEISKCVLNLAFGVRWWLNDGL